MPKKKILSKKVAKKVQTIKRAVHEARVHGISRRGRPKKGKPPVSHKEKEVSILVRYEENPVLVPNPSHSWESKAVFNPAALLESGRVHLLYRAIGDNDISVLGYASSPDGVRFDERLENPAYVPREEFEGRSMKKEEVPNFYCSGGGWGGCEDPRLVRIDDTVYMTYAAYDGWLPRMAITRIKADDFLAHRWNWGKSVLISPPNQVNKNWVLFPEKINGKFAILHSLSPEIQISYFDELDFDGKTFIESRYFCKPREECWDRVVRGAGPPPIKTKYGWLVIYHAATKNCGYKMGAMILDFQNPTKILYRSDAPLLGPETWYENEGLKPRIVYSCGAVVINGQLFVYYGGADTVTAMATMELEDLLLRIRSSKEIKASLIKKKVL